MYDAKAKQIHKYPLQDFIRHSLTIASPSMLDILYSHLLIVASIYSILLQQQRSCELCDPNCNRTI